jgi:hypothetical protein
MFLVSLAISYPPPFRADKPRARRVEHEAGAAAKAAAVHVRLFAGDKYAAVTRAALAARRVLYDHTVDMVGVRLCASATWPTLERALDKARQDYLAAVAAFLGDYDAARAEAEARLGALFQEVDFPSREQIEKKFDFSVLSVPLTEDSPDPAARSIVQTAMAQARAAVIGGIRERLRPLVDVVMSADSRGREVRIDTRHSLAEALRICASLAEEVGLPADVTRSLEEARAVALADPSLAVDTVRSAAAGAGWEAF